MNILFDVGMAVGPVIGYLYQYRLIFINQTTGTFSIDICGILLFANILRLNFYLFQPYSTALLFQSFNMITTHLLLLKLCAQLPPKTVQADMTATHPNYLEREESFWRWKNFRSYFLTIILFALATFSISLLCLNFSFYGQVVGFVSLLSQSLLIAPQIVKNFKMRKVKGLSHLLITLNWNGDVIKVIYFLINKQPFQFIMCGVIQIILDTTVIGQIIYYRRRQRTIRKAVLYTKEKKSHVLSEQSNFELPVRQLAVKISEGESMGQLSAKGEEVKEEMENSPGSQGEEGQRGKICSEKEME